MAASATVRIGVDTGGTFTDLLCLDDQGLRVYKLRSTPADPSRAIMDGIRTLVPEASGAPGLEITHGSTVATNAVLERKGARVALITTAGFEDVLRIGRQTRPELYNFYVRRPEPLVPRELTFGLDERLAADGSVLRPLDGGQLETLIATLETLDVESIAVCFLHSYANSSHEEQTATALRGAGFLVSASHEILPEYREYERWSTTAVNAYVAPLMARYLQRLQKQLGRNTLRIMQSNGGSISSERAGQEAVQTILSGPAAGVVGAQVMGQASGFNRLITFDMGGTSTDVSLIDGALSVSNESMVADLPVRVPVLDIHTVGAGGGSVVWVDSGAGLRVGPRSAGADPGPVCFGVGEELTVTDANLLLGRLDPTYFLGGRMSLDLPRTRKVARSLARKLGLRTRTLAEGIVRIANANMERAVRVVSVQRGFDPREFALLAFGGAGGLHACDLAASLDIRTVLIPEHSGVLSALGMLMADVVKNYSSSVLQASTLLTWGDLEARLAPLRARANQDLATEGFRAEDITLGASLALRYRGQAFEIDVPIFQKHAAEGADQSAPIDAIVADFHQQHARLYGYSNPARATEVVQLRLRAMGRTVKPPLLQPDRIEPCPLPVPDTIRTTIFSGRQFPTPIFHRSRLVPGVHGEGPTIMVTGESTSVVPPGWKWHIDKGGTLAATLKTNRYKGSSLAD